MSLESQTDVQCPKCGHTQAVTVWRSLNTSFDPKAKLDLLEGRVNVFQCCRCDYQAELPVSLLYHDTNRRFMVHYYPFESLDDPEFLRDFDPRGESLSAAEMSRRVPGNRLDYMTRVHVVFQMSELVRYILFRDRLHAHHQGSGGPA